MQVGACRGQGLVAEDESDGRTAGSCGLQPHREGMPKDMGGDVLGGDAGTCRGCLAGVDLDAPGNGVGAHLPGGAVGGEHEDAEAGGVLALPLPQPGNGGLLERAQPFLPAFAVPEDAGSRLGQGDVSPGEAGDL